MDQDRPNSVLHHLPAFRTILGIGLGLLTLLLSMASRASEDDDHPGVSAKGATSVALIGERVERYMEVQPSAQGPAIDPKKGYRVENVGDGLYVVTNNVYQSMFMVYDSGVVLMDVPPSLVTFIPEAISSVTRKPITHIVYSHAHIDHIGGAGQMAGSPEIIAHIETAKLLGRAKDPARPLPTRTFTSALPLKLGHQQLNLSYPGTGISREIFSSMRRGKRC